MADTTWNIEDLNLLKEDADIEAKQAAGRDGLGQLPKNFWETYSAMANTSGGAILLGVKEDADGKFELAGIVEIDRIKKQLWNLVHSRDQISANVLREEDVQEVEIEGTRIIVVHVPRARRIEKPVYVGRNPMTGTYQRRFDGDYRCSEEVVRRMLAEQVNDSRDERILSGFTMDDLEGASLRSYRQRFQNRDPSHPWNDRDDREFLMQLGGWRRDRVSGEEGPTMAGLLMFGKLRAIQDELPKYHVDYQEWPESAGSERWEHRITTDGTWSGNVFDFFRRTYSSLTSELRVPFRIREGVRQEVTPVHEALREALVNCLIHADWEADSAVVVVSRPSLFEFRNPGTMRVPLDLARKGGDSDCRNRAMQRMFRMVGFGEQAGSGIPKILRNWQDQSWRAPVIEEHFDRETTSLKLHMTSLFPESIVDELEGRFGSRFANTTTDERLALVTAAAEGVVTHARLRELCDSHSRDLTLALAKLATEGLLDKEGRGKALQYFLGEKKEDLLPFARPVGGPGSVQSAASSVQIPGSSVQSAASSVQSPEMDSKKRGWSRREELRSRILETCATKYLSVAELAALLGRSEATIRINYVSPMVKDGLLEERYPETPTHPKQAYRTATKDDS